MQLDNYASDERKQLIHRVEGSILKIMHRHDLSDSVTSASATEHRHNFLIESANESLMLAAKTTTMAPPHGQRDTWSIVGDVIGAVTARRGRHVMQHCERDVTGVANRRRRPWAWAGLCARWPRYAGLVTVLLFFFARLWGKFFLKNGWVGVCWIMKGMNEWDDLKWMWVELKYEMVMARAINYYNNKE